MSLLDHVQTTIDALDLDDRTAARATALAELVRMHARYLDGQAAASARADRALRLAEREGDPDLLDLVTGLRSRLSEGTALERIGRELRTGLIELQATPRSRPEADRRPPASSPLGELRAVAGGAA